MSLSASVTLTIWLVNPESNRANTAWAFVLSLSSAAAIKTLCGRFQFEAFEDQRGAVGHAEVCITGGKHDRNGHFAPGLIILVGL